MRLWLGVWHVGWGTRGHAEKSLGYHFVLILFSYDKKLTIGIYLLQSIYYFTEEQHSRTAKKTGRSVLMQSTQQ